MTFPLEESFKKLDEMFLGVNTELSTSIYRDAVKLAADVGISESSMKDMYSIYKIMLINAK